MAYQKTHQMCVRRVWRVRISATCTIFSQLPLGHMFCYCSHYAHIIGIYGMLPPLHRPGTICSLFSEIIAISLSWFYSLNFTVFPPLKYFQILRTLYTSYATCRRSHNIPMYTRNKYSILNSMFVFSFFVQHVHWMEKKISNCQQGDNTTKDRSNVTS